MTPKEFPVTRALLLVAYLLLGLAPAGVCAGVWLAAGAGWGVCAGSAGYGLLGLALLTLDLLPNPAPPREATR